MSDGPRTTILGKLVILAFIAGCGWLAWHFFAAGAGKAGAGPSPQGGPAPSANALHIGIAYGTEKQRWMEWAAQKFSESDAGKAVAIDLLPMGSLEGAQALVRGDQRIHAWSPASSLYKETFVADWQVKYGNQPILAQEQLALTPMVWVWWDERWQAFAAKYQQCTFTTIGQALGEQGGWDAIAGKPEWGLFKFGHTHPNQSNSGLVTLVLMAYEYQKRDRGLTLKDILDTGFQGWLGGFESAVSSLPNSTGTMMKEMVLKGPSAFDAVMVYENVAIDYLRNAEGRWGALHIVYPQSNVWNDNPFYVIDASWSSPEQRKAAKDFLAFLMSEPVQREALNHGFRPGNPNVGVRFPGSPFEVFQKNGLRNDISNICETPKAEVVTNLLESWQRARGNR
jgi:Ca-activated chloride channel family protein